MALKNYKVEENTRIGWERELYDFIVNQKPADADREFTIQRPDAVTLNIRCLYSSPEAAVIEVTYIYSNRSSTRILIKINDVYYDAYPNEISWLPSQEIFAAIYP